MRLLVTGGAGFIGSNFIRYVFRETDDVQVTNLNALTYAVNLASLRDVDQDPRYRFIRGDVSGQPLVDELVSNADAVVHFAAESHVDRSTERPAEFLRTNLLGAGIAFEAARRHQVERGLHISIDEVSGSIAEPGAFVEIDALMPNSPYSASKAAAALLARPYNVTYGFPITVTRTASNFGPYQYPEKVIPLFVTNLIDGETVPLYGDGRNVRDWTYVVDNASARWRVLIEGTPVEVYNVGAGKELSNKELTYAILAQFGLEGDAADQHIRFLHHRPGHDLRYSVDTSKIRQLGWEPATSFEDGLESTVAWYRDNEWWLRPLEEQGASDRRGA